MNLGNHIKQLRNENDKTLHHVAMGTDIDSTLLSKIERGDRLPTDEQVTKLALFFQIPVEELKIQSIAEKIIKDYGLNETTLGAIDLVKETAKKNRKND